MPTLLAFALSACLPQQDGGSSSSGGTTSSTSPRRSTNSLPQDEEEDDEVVIEPISVIPSLKTLAVGNVAALTLSGGLPPYTFQLVAGGGSFDEEFLRFTAPNYPGMSLLRIKDSSGLQTEAMFVTNPPLTITPPELGMTVNNSYLFRAADGVSPYEFSLVSGTGTIDSLTGAYVAPEFPTSATVRVTDSLGNQADSNILIFPALRILPTNKTLAVGNTFTFNTLGGVPPFRFAMTSGGGSIDADTGYYQAPSTSGSASVRVTDAFGNVQVASISINPALRASPVSKTMAVTNSFRFAATGGAPPYAFVLTSGQGSLDPSTGLFVAPGNSGSATIRVVDSMENTSDIAVTINPALRVSPTSKTLAVGNTFNLSASDGAPPYSYSIASGGGAINFSNGLYTAAETSGTALVRTTDDMGNEIDTQVTINPALAISPPTASVYVAGNVTFTGTGGVPPYTFSRLVGGGSVDSVSGIYSAASSPGNAVVRITDSLGNLSDATISITSVQISPKTRTLAVGNSHTFSAAGGTQPYTFSILSGAGSIDPSTGQFTAPSSAGTVIVRATDQSNIYDDATVVVNPALAISPSAKTLAVDNAITFVSSGGVPPYTYSLTSGGGSVDSSTGQYTSPSTPGTATVRATDSLGNTSDAAIIVNPALAISPSTKTLAIGNTATFTASGGVGSYSYSVQVGAGTINSVTGIFTAPATPGATTVRVSDSLGNVSDATVTTNASLAISPTSKTIAAGSIFTLAGSGGVPPYLYSITSGGGSIDSATGAYTAAGSAGAAQVRVTDSQGNFAESSLTINPPLAINPTSKSLPTGTGFTFSASGGVAPYEYSIFSGGGTINTSTGAFTSASTSGSATIRVTDSLGNTSDSSVSVVDAVAINPTSKTLAAGNSATFTASGGLAPYNFTVQSGSGSIGSSSGVYTAPASAGTATVRVTDSLGQYADASISINPALAISPATITLAVGNAATFSASGGLAPYTFSVGSGSGTVNSTTGVYTAPASAGSATVRVTDALGNTSDAVVTTNTALALTPGSATLAYNATRDFVASGGVSPFTYTVVSGIGSISATGTYTAPGASGSATLRVTDSLGNTGDATVTVVSPVAISPATITLAVGNSTSFSASGGLNPYTYSVTAGNGTVGAGSGLFTASTIAGSATVRVTDAIGQTSEATVTVNAALAISPSTKSMPTSTSFTFEASGGVAPYSYSLYSGGGSIVAATGAYTSAASAGSATVRVTDSIGNTSDSAVTIVSPVSITPSVKTLAVNNSTTFSGSGGLAPYVFSVQSGGGSIGSTSGAYTAPSTSGSAVVRVTDSLGQYAEAPVTINSALAISPSSKTLAIQNVFVFSATGGVTPYSYSLLSGSGSIHPTTGSYTAPATPGSATIRVTDSLGNTSDASVTINAALAISPSTATIASGATQGFSASGGAAPYSYAVFTGIGSVDAVSGIYTAPAFGGSAAIRVTDTAGNTSDASVTVVGGVGITPSTLTLAVNNSYTFSASGGSSPYSFSISAGQGTINSSTGQFTAPASTGTATVRVTDNVGQYSEATVTINPALTITPTSKSMATNTNFTFGASGGVAPYEYSVFAGGGSISSTTGAYTSPATAGSATIRVTDSIGNTSNSTVTIASPVLISPTSLSLAVSNQTTFTASGGLTPYTYSVQSGGGSIGATNGIYTAPGVTGSAIVRVTDSLGQYSESTVTINAALAISPNPKTLAVDNQATFSASGGVAPYSYSIFSGSGTVVPGTGVYTAPSSAGSATVRVTDSLGNTSDASVTVNAALAISPTSVSVAANSSQTFTASAGVPPYVYSVFSGIGSIHPTTGSYTAPASTGVATVRVTDSLGNTRDASVTVTAGLSISPATKTLAVNNITTFSAAGGSAPYVFSISAGQGTINASSGQYTAPGSSGTATIRVTDANSSYAEATVTINTALAISPASKHLAISNAYSFGANGGVAPYTFSLFSGSGSVTSDGQYTAPSVSTSATVRVTDSIGNTSDASITVHPALAISPSTLQLAVNGTYTFTASNGSTLGYAYSVLSGGGSINSSTGEYTAPSSTGSATIRVTDDMGNTSNAAVTIASPLAISPNTKSLMVGNSFTFTASGGSGSYSYSLAAGGGSIGSSTGAYTAPGTSGSATVRVTDTLGATSDATVTINPQLAISPTSLTLYTSGTQTFTATGGVPAYSYSVVSGGGSIVSSTGAYTAGTSSGAVTIRVTDSLGNTSNSTVNVVAPGDLDTSLAGTGIVSTNMGGTDAGYAIAVQPSDQKIVVAGTSGGDFALARYNTDGSLDTSFNGTGKILQDLGTTTDIAYSVAIQGDGKIVAAGSAGGDVAVARFNTNGTLDTTFNSVGYKLINVGASDDAAKGVVIQTVSGATKILLAGYTGTAGTLTTYDSAILRLNENGSADTSFNTTGTIIIDVAGNKEDRSHALAVQPSTNKIVVVGFAKNGSRYDYVVLRYSSDGVLDTTFDGDSGSSNGIVVIDVSNNDVGTGVVVQPSDEKILVGGYSGSSNNWAAVRLSSSTGAKDTSGFGGGTGYFSANSGDYGRAVAIQSDGKILLIGESTVSSKVQFATIRLTSAGVVDTTFGTSGVVKTGIGAGDSRAQGIAVQSDGKIVVGGTTNVGSGDDFTIIRYWP